MHTPGWATLMTILESSGERPPKRPNPFGNMHNGNGHSADSMQTNGGNGVVRDASASPSLNVDQLAKRVKWSSLNK
jgi:nuclear protein localization family protein 4